MKNQKGSEAIYLFVGFFAGIIMMLLNMYMVTSKEEADLQKEAIMLPTLSDDIDAGFQISSNSIPWRKFGSTKHYEFAITKSNKDTTGLFREKVDPYSSNVSWIFEEQQKMSDSDIRLLLNYSPLNFEDD